MKSGQRVTRKLTYGAHLRIGFDCEDPVAGAGQPDGLRSLPRAHIQD
jgi:hypothetical protein